MNKDFRTAYAEAAKKESAVKTLETLINQEDKDSAIVLGYQGALQALKGNYTFFPTMKLSYFWSASGYFEQALKLEPQNVEVLFLRFTVECGVPAIMSYALHLSSDRKKIVELLPKSKLEKSFKKAMIDFMLESGKCTEEEIEILRKIVP